MNSEEAVETTKEVALNVATIMHILIDKKVCTEDEFKKVRTIYEDFYDKKMEEILKSIKENK